MLLAYFCICVALERHVFVSECMFLTKEYSSKTRYLLTFLGFKMSKVLFLLQYIETTFTVTQSDFGIDNRIYLQE